MELSNNNNETMAFGGFTFDPRELRSQQASAGWTELMLSITSTVGPGADGCAGTPTGGITFLFGVQAIRFEPGEQRDGAFSVELSFANFPDEETAQSEFARLMDAGYKARSAWTN